MGNGGWLGICGVGKNRAPGFDTTETDEATEYGAGISWEGAAVTGSYA